MVILLFPPPHAQYSVPDRRKRWKCVFGRLSLTFRMYVGMKPGWFMAEDQAIFETEDFEPFQRWKTKTLLLGTGKEAKFKDSVAGLTHGHSKWSHRISRFFFFCSSGVGNSALESSPLGPGNLAGLVYSPPVRQLDTDPYGQCVSNT